MEFSHNAHTNLWFDVVKHSIESDKKSRCKCEVTHFCSDTCSHCLDEVKVKNLQQFLLWKAHVSGSNLSLHVMIHFGKMNGIMVNHLLSSQANTSYLILLIHPLHKLSSSFGKLKRKASLYSKEYHWHMSFDIKLSWEIYCFTYSQIFEYFIMAIDQEEYGGNVEREFIWLKVVWDFKIKFILWKEL